MLIKPREFLDQAETPKRRYNLNNTSALEVTKRKGIYANQTPQRGRGCGNYSWRPSTPTTSSAYNPGALNRCNMQSPTTHTTNSTIRQSPLQRRNMIHFTDMWWSMSFSHSSGYKLQDERRPPLCHKKLLDYHEILIVPSARLSPRSVILNLSSSSLLESYSLLFYSFFCYTTRGYFNFTG